MKRAFDFFLSLFGLVISSPFWLLFGLAIWLEDGGAIFYAQDRVGKDGLIFESLKFRSMVIDIDEKTALRQAEEEDTRVTKIGRILRATAMDELPQLANILKGEMSFVGPRALQPVEKEVNETKPRSVWEIKGFKERSVVQPGLTGVAQILAPRDIPRQEKFKYDIWYIKNRNFSLDLRLIILSFFITFRGAWEKRGDKLSRRILEDLSKTL
jgi:lipopolysaccharide/colanic/teichoic acid biosynthesis glycosyltransferase